MSDPKWPNFGTYVRTFFFQFRPHRDPAYLFVVTSVRIADLTSLATNVKFFPARQPHSVRMYLWLPFLYAYRTRTLLATRFHIFNAGGVCEVKERDLGTDRPLPDPLWIGPAAKFFAFRPHRDPT